ncbi:MAG: cobalamin-dependent protein [Actinobacteria bacterium]|nr:cobalamin-dependent protein [Actinomycetota bacterium]
MDKIIRNGMFEDVQEVLGKMLQSGIKSLDISNFMTTSIQAVGDLFGKKEIFLPQLMLSARTVKIGMESLKPFLRKNDIKSKIGKIIMATVEGDLHEIGKNLVILLSEVEGFDVIDLGVDVSINTIVESAKENKPEIIGLSSLLTTTMSKQKECATALRREGILGKSTLFIGGAPVTEDWANEIGAKYAPDAQEAVKRFKQNIKNS